VLTKTSNLTPFAPHGFNGIFRGASMVFFAYLVGGHLCVCVCAGGGGGDEKEVTCLTIL
jgi:hypothetical protein